ncbi:gliding motility-associated C-terminal domain-containing protein, partial [Bacteroidales bacterium AH-315-I05]|nr:gliding motility-associated C-terminal domain-containing protein [Bacteroidales bacterium AH-315-I05]
GICNGSADITVTGGITPFSFLWSHGPTAEDPINLCAGNYTVTVTDANSIQQTHSITINEPTVFTVSNTITDASCSGKCDGIINISVSGGTTAYSYSWSNSATTEDITLLCAGSYSVTITDANSCDTILSFSITEPAPITISFSSTDANCGQTDGTAAASAAGGSTPYSYQWDASAGSQTTAGVTDLATGTFVITITDNAGCQAIGNVIIGNQTGGATSATVTSNVACNGGNNGAATASMTGGITPYSYNWSTSPAQTNTSATGLTAGSYNVTITDAVGCADIAMITITEPTPVAVSISGNNVICFGNCDGDAIATANGGTSPYSYQWNNPLFQTTVNATGLCANTFNVTITDANNCTTTGNINISQPAQLILDSDSTNSTCGNADGTATVMVTSGLTPYNYQWGASAGSQTNATATGLLAGCYNVTVTDGNSCTAMRSVCVLDDGSPTILLLTKTNASCNGACDGFAQVSVSGGTLPYSYSWYDNSMNPIGQTTASASNLCAGTYTGETADGNGCIASMSVVITEPTLLVAVISLSTDVTCFGYCDGQATATPSGGTTPYSYQWNDINLQTTQTATGLCPGSYGVTIIDNNNCDTTISVTINEPADIISSTSFTDAFCNTASGQACVTIASGGISPFNYVWDDGSSQTTSCANNLTPGIYNVTVTDANGCTEINSATVGNIPSGTATISSSINVSCNGLCDGQATVSMGGSGTAPYSYDWGNGQTGQTATGICDGNYTVTVTDANTCTATASVIITEPAVLNTGTTGTDTRCYSECSGTATSTASGGTAPYTYLWNNPLAQTDATATGLCSITYQVTVTDGAGCTVIDSVTINEPAPIVLDTNVSNANCGQANGFACLTVTGGIGPYSYLWQDGETTNCISSKVAGTYFVTVTDDNACVAITSAVIQNLNGPTASIASSSDVNCNGVCDGSATVSYSGGTGPITIEWLDNTGTSIGQTTPTASNLCAGTYTVKVKDSVQCIASVTVIINQPPAITYSTSQSNPICTGDCNGSATVTANGGTSPYSYQWNDPNNQTNATATGLCTGNYILNLTDANGCVEIINYMLINPLALTASVSVIDVSCNGLCDGQATTNASNGTTPYSYQWNDSNNQLTQTANGLCAGFYSVTITDINGCTTTANATITEPTALSASISGSGNVSCSGLCDGYAQVSPSGGTPGYIYNWSGGSINQVASNLCAGGYVVTVTDLNGCITQTSVSITQPQPLSTTIPSTSNVNCSGVCNGQATVSVSGGTPSYNYQWSINTGGQISQTVTGLCGGNYSVTVSDANGCASNTNTIITEPNPLGIIINSTTNASCNLDNGSICIGTTGGTAPYTYQWNDPYTQTGACASNLFAGCYLVIVTDANGCTVDSLICINNNAGPTITLNSVSNVICFGGSTGSLSFSVTGGVTPYTSIEWFDGTGTQLTLYSDSLSVSSLPFGNYTIQVIDGVGCIVSLSQFVNQPPNLVASIVSSSDVLCAGGNDGMATVGANGGTTPYSYLWSNGANTTFATGLVAGTYSVTIFDNNGCAKTALATINEPTSMSVSSSVQNISCNNNCNGIIAVTTSGGTAPYIFDWFPNINSNPTATNLCAGNYTVLITDAQGCDTSFNFTITQQQPMIITDTVIPATCGNCNGQATVSVSGGNTPYGYQWDVGQYFPTANGLCPTTHTITITDASGCDSVYSVLITDDSGPVISNINFTEPSCNGTPTGTATVIFSGGISPSPIWDNGFVGITSINLMAGIHCVTVTDFNGCNDVQCVNITEPPALTAIGNGSTTICYGEFAPVWASGAGGTPNYTISWDGGFAGTGPHNVSPTSTTDYCFDIADGNGCIDSACVTITVLPQLSTTVTPGTYVSICEGDSANICINASGGNGGLYDFTWSTGFTETEVTGSCVTANENSSNPFIVTVSDNCSTDETVQIDLNMNPTPTAFFFTNELAGCPPFSVNFSSSSSSLLPVNYAWDFDGDGSIDNNEQNPQAIYSSTGIYDVSLTISTDSGCPTTYNELNYITVWPTPIAGFIADPQTTTLMLSTIEFNTSGLTIGGDSLLIWDFDDGTELSTTDLISSHTYEETGTYSVLLTAYNQYGCSDTATGIVVIKDDFILFAPNAFTPINNDGKNDYFMPKGVGINPNNFAMYIFDRWGDIIYETHNPDKPWDGKVQSKSKLVKQDVYVWIVVTVDENDDDVQFIGHVTVVK